ncbi:putative O-glycosylation ligase, exosortase A system-associated [Hydrogenophaga sp.]|uniref:putative O-glycosylation ligase, exosortase A system-associated n=1 Tax=Hydrogenophaga sp. TaxID=1904254 RepID=UPI00286D9AED|nr:putative O-glycosylation ligase, exosortase A system-associated [Hydrogenophaga sp.]
MRDLMVFAVMLGMVPMALMNGFVAFLLWVYTNLLSPHIYLYGFMISFRYAFVFAALALGSLAMGRLKDRGKFLVDKSTVLLMLFIVHTVVSSLLAWDSNPAVEFRLEYFIKGMTLAVVAPLFLNTRWRIHLTVLVLVAGLGFHGVVDGLKMVNSGGSHIIYGIPRSTLSDNNLYALGMVMLLPLTLYMAKYSTHQWVRWGFLGTFGLCVMTILGSNSRGGFLALAILGIWYWVTSPRKVLSTVFVVIVAVGVVQFAPDRWFERIETIKDAEQDSSFLGRLAAWKVSVNIANDNPFFGAGFDATMVTPIWEQYKYDANFIDIDIPKEMSFKAAHSNYFQVMGDLGYVGLIIFLALLASAFMTRWQIQSLAKQSKRDVTWAVDLATSVNLSLVAFMAGGAGVSLAYFELAHLEIVMLCVIRRLLMEQAAQQVAVAVPGREVAHA